MTASNSSKLSLSKRTQLRCRRKSMHAKPKPRARIRPQSARARKEAAIVGKVFREIEERDGRCALSIYVDLYEECWPGLIGVCGGESQPAHLADWRRGTCKLPPEERSTRKTIVRLCADHHRRYDQHKFDIQYSNAGAEGYIQPVYRKTKGAA